MFDAESILAKYGLAEPPDPVEPKALGPAAISRQSETLQRLADARVSIDIIASLVRSHPDRMDCINAASNDLVTRLHEAGLGIERLRLTVDCAGEA